MRERLVVAFVGLTVVVVALYGVPRAYILADLVRDQAQQRIDRTAELVAVTVAERREAGRPVNTAYLDELAADGEEIRLRLDNGKTIGTSDWTEPAGSDISTVVDVDGGGAVTVARDGDEVGEAIAEALLPLVILGLLLVVLAGLAGYVLARRLSRPFQDLAVAARGLGAGRLEVDLPDYRIPEAQQIAAALSSSGEKLGALLQHERDVAVHASHELRTPVTALRLELEDLALWPETTPEVAAQLGRSVAQLDRLDDAIATLLASSKGVSAADEVDVDLGALVADTVDRLGAAGTGVTHEATGPMPTRLSPGPVVAALELLLPSAERVGEVDRGSHLEIHVSGLDPVDPAERDRAFELLAGAGGQVTDVPEGLVIRLPKRPLSGPPA